MKFQVDRKIWWRGQGSPGSLLLRRDGKMCCVGFFCLASGLTKDDIIGRATIAPDFRVLSDKELSKWCVELSPHVALGVYNTNDQKGLLDSAREEKLIELFAQLGHEVEFIN